MEEDGAELHEADVFAEGRDAADDAGGVDGVDVLEDVCGLEGVGEERQVEQVVDRGRGEGQEVGQLVLGHDVVEERGD